MIDRLYGFDAHAEKYYEEASWYYDRVKSGMSMLSSGTWDEVNGKFKLDIAKMHWAGEIYSKNKEKDKPFKDLFGGLKTLFLKMAEIRQKKLLEEYAAASPERQVEITEELKSNTKLKQNFTDSKIYIDDWQLVLMGWDKSRDGDYVLTEEFMRDLNTTMEKYGITTPERIRHFIAQASMETGKGIDMTEWDDDDLTYFQRYEPGTPAGTRLGNTEVGDGYKFRGVGGIQMTGRWNYQAFSNYLKEKEGIDDPEIMNQGYQYVVDMYPWQSSGWYWQVFREINGLIDNGATVEDVLQQINPGDSIESLNQRKQYYDDASKYFY